jgi:pimeloyl-ACP methyl ester carboxylesterase
MPIQISSKYKTFEKVPRVARRFLASKEFFRKTVGVAGLRGETGAGEKGRNTVLLSEMQATDPRSMADIDYRKVVERNLLEYLPRIKNRTRFIYGDSDKQTRFIDEKLGERKRYTAVLENTGHNIFRTNPKGTLEKVEKILTFQ